MAKEDMKKAGVYAIRNLRNGKRYVGSTSTTFKSRWCSHLHRLRKGNHHNRILQKEWNSSEESDFVFEICEITLPEHAVAVEQTFIDYYRSTTSVFGYNIAKISSSTRGVRHTAESRMRISKSMKKLLESPESRAERSERMKRVCGTEEAREANRQRQIKRWSSPEARAASSARMKKKHESPEFREMHSEMCKKSQGTKESKEQKSEKMKRIWQTPEYQEKIKERFRKRFRDPVARQAASDKASAWQKKKTPEQKAETERKRNLTRTLKAASKLLVVIQPEQCSCCSSTLTEGISDGH